MYEEETFAPPPGPPPLLSPEQVKHIAYHGWLLIELPGRLNDALGELSHAVDAFFDQKIEQKEALYPSSQGTECGYYVVKGEKEYVSLRRLAHADTRLEELAGIVWKEAARLLYRVLCDISRAGCYDLQIWDHLIESSMSLPEDDSSLGDVTTLLRLFRYYPTNGFAAEHADIGLLTLCVGTGKGLQMLDKSREPAGWIDADGPVILVGEMTRALLKSRVRAGVHRVIGNPNGRSSIVFALRPCLKHPTDLAMFGGEGVVDTREFFYKIKGAKWNVNARQEVRERQREEQQRRLQQAQARTSGFEQG